MLVPPVMTTVFREVGTLLELSEEDDAPKIYPKRVLDVPSFVAPTNGRVMLARLVHPKKASASMLATPDGIVMLSRLVQPENALSPMLDTLSGIVTLVRLVQPLNASYPMLVTVSPEGEVCGMTISVSVQVPMPET